MLSIYRNIPNYRVIQPQLRPVVQKFCSKFHNMAIASEIPEQYASTRIVDTASGPIVGRRFTYENQRPVDAFQGIPYAKPPVGELRFKKPVLPEPWSEPLRTQAFGASSVQWEDANINKALPVSEDCLTLNVFAPTWRPEDNKGFPVMVYIHGGGAVRGSSVTPGDVNIGEHLVSKDVIIVTIQYRVGFLGFWTTGCEKCPGNWGLWDATFALKWIQKNIANFNGDASNVTVMGNCVGGAMADMLSLSPHSCDLFHKVVYLSGNACIEKWAIHHNGVEACRRKAVKMGVHSFYDTDTYLDDLLKLPAYPFGTTFYGEHVDQNNDMECQIGPRIDGDFFTKSVSELRKEAPPKPKIIGCCRYDGLLFPVLLGKYDFSLNSMQERIASMIDEREHPNDYAKMRREIVQKLLKSPATASQDEINLAQIELISDFMMNVGTQKAVIESTNHNEIVYFFCFEHFNPNYIGRFRDRTPFLGATHMMELPFLFGRSFPFKFQYDEVDKKVLHTLTSYITNFGIYGNPNGDSESNLVHWERTTSSNQQRHLRMSQKSRMSEKFMDGRPLIYLPKSKL